MLFPFDDHSIPFSAGLRLHLASGKPPGAKTPVVVGKGPAGAPDDDRVRFYGTSSLWGDELRMWYLGWKQPRRRVHAPRRYADQQGRLLQLGEPRLGLVEHNGSSANNLVAFGDGETSFAALPVIHDPDDPDPARRYKCAFESGRYGNCLAVAFSPDGLRWTIPDFNPVAPMLEQTGLIKFNGCYYVNGQGGRHFGSARKLVSFASYDFEHWTHATAWVSGATRCRRKRWKPSGTPGRRSTWAPGCGTAVTCWSASTTCGTATPRATARSSPWTWGCW